MGDLSDIQGPDGYYYEYKTDPEGYENVLLALLAEVWARKAADRYKDRAMQNAKVRLQAAAGQFMMSLPTDTLTT